MIEFKPRYFVLPAIAIAVLAMLHPADRRARGAGLAGSADRATPASAQASRRLSGNSHRPPQRPAPPTPTPSAERTTPPTRRRQ